MVLTITLNSTLDIIVPVLNLQKGKVLRTKIIYSYPGGKGTNVARALSELGIKTFATGFCGDKTFNFMDNFLKKYNIKNEFIKVKGENRPCILITELKNKKETIINSESTFKIAKKEIKKFFYKIKILSKKCPFCVISGSLPISLPQNFYENVINNIKTNSFILLDTSSNYLKYGIKASPDAIKLNIEEFKKTFNINFKTKKSFKNFISFLSKKYKIKTIIITLNEKGAILFNQNNFYFFNSIKPKNFLSPVGSGDAFSAGFIYGLYNKKDIIDSLKYAIACATANLTHLGSCFIEKKEVISYINKVKYSKY